MPSDDSFLPLATLRRDDGSDEAGTVNATAATGAGHPRGAARVTDRYRQFHRGLSELWEGFELVRAIVPPAGDQLRAGTLPPIAYRTLGQQRNIKRLSLSDALGVMSRFQTRTVPAQTLMQATGAMELLVADTATLIYVEFPAATLKETGVTDGKREAKLVSMILESHDRAEIINRLVEEKVRSSTYGSPTDLFLNDGLRLRLGSHFKTGHESLLATWTEASARRNLWVHNDGRVDRKYLREVPASTLSHGQVAVVDESYLVAVIVAIRKLGACAVFRTIESYFHVQSRGKLGSVYRSVHP